MTAREQWRPVVDWPEYEVSDLGRVRRVGAARGAVAGAILKQKVGTTGYLRVRLSRDFYRTPVAVHRAVAMAFIPRAVSSANWVCHRDGDKLNNSLGNLYWGTPADNSADTIRHGRSLKGVKNASAVLSEAQVRAIREKHAAGVAKKALAREYGVSDAAIRFAVTRYTWGHVA